MRFSLNIFLKVGQMHGDLLDDSQNRVPMMNGMPPIQTTTHPGHQGQQMFAQQQQQKMLGQQQPAPQMGIGNPQMIPKPGQLPNAVKQNRLTTLPKPDGIDPATLLQERELRIANRMAYRLNELKSIPTNMAEDLRTKVSEIIATF